MPSKKYYARNKDKYRKESLKYYLTHREKRDRINKIWRKNNPDKAKAIDARYLKKYKEIIREKGKKYCKIHKIELSKYGKKWRKNNSEKSKNRKLKWNYGITYEDYMKILQNQNNECGVCGIKFKDIYKFPDLRSPCVDHAHVGKKEVRGILCRGCNSGMGLFDDNPSLLKNALRWLTKKEYNFIFDKNWFQKKIREPFYEQIFNGQDGKCGICKKDLSHIRTNLDHNHFSMRIRGLLCIKCNKALGFLKDDLIIIKNSIIWLTKENRLKKRKDKKWLNIL